MGLRSATLFVAFLALSRISAKNVDPLRLNIFYYQDKLMTVPITIGTPPQTLNLALDSTSAETIVVGKDCTKPDLSPCLNDGNFTRKAFKPELSSSLTNLSASYLTTRYDYSDIVYEVFADTANLGGFQITNASFGMADFIDKLDTWLTADGLLGLGLIGHLGASIAPNTTHLYSNTSIAMIWLEDYGVPNGAGLLTLGGYDSVNCLMTDFVTVPITSQFEWNFIFTGVSMSSYKYGKNLLATVDTTSKYTYVPADVLGNIVQIIGATFDSQVGSWFVPCLGASDFPPIVFNIGKRSFNIIYKEFVESYQHGSRCELLFKVNQQWENTHFGVQVRLGHSWIRSYCTVFNYADQTLGFTLANHLF